MLGLDSKSRRRVWLKRAIWLGVLAAVLTAAVWWYLQNGGSAATISYQTTPAARADLIIEVQATGTIQPTTQVDVSSEMSGVIRTVNVDNNSLVQKGEVLARLDTVKLTAQLARSRASLAASEARLLETKATREERRLALERAEALHKKGVSAIQDLDAARANFARAEASVTAAEADINVAKAEVALVETDISKASILSPVDGIVLKRSAEPGQTVASSLQAPILFTLAEDLARMQVEADIDEADIGAVKPEQEATFTVDAYPGQKFPASIQTIEYSPTTTENVVTYKAILTVDNKDLLLRPGMTATAEIVTQRIDQALTVPNAALRYRPPRNAGNQGFSITNIFIPRMPRFEKSSSGVNVEGQRSLWVLDNGVPREVKVKTGASDGQNTVVLSGELKAGDAVITGTRQAAP
ncbi:MAG: efflux RND transporter periplasmic adaptor subunit [Alphaproteobacteria bacterium]|nr:efflux RND transporter periplasmic adaptor subunit [Alphaproteobacteria bacterium]